MIKTPIFKSLIISIFYGLIACNQRQKIFTQKEVDGSFKKEYIIYKDSILKKYIVTSFYDTAMLLNKSTYKTKVIKKGKKTKTKYFVYNIEGGIDSITKYTNFIPTKATSYYNKGQLKVKGKYSRKSYYYSYYFVKEASSIYYAKISVKDTIWKSKGDSSYFFLISDTVNVDVRNLHLPYNVNLKHGKWQYWNEKGKLIKEEFWEKGKLLREKEY